jgi:aryl-alcohol dehydrogenase-like predicted oxidoreductase
MDYATKEGTFKYLKQFPKYSKDFYRFNGELFFSSLGLGTYRKEPYREENYIVNYKDAVKTAILNGINLIDTAINYRYQVSEQEIGEALMELFDEGKVQRESLIITSKAGFLPLEFPFPENPYEWIKSHIIEKELATPEEIVIDQHCMSPAYLRWSVEQSLKNLHLNTLDILFLHNPETQLGYVEREVVLSRIKEAFTLFEQLVKEGKIRHYGIASWNAFLYDEDHTEYLSLNDIMQIAQEVGGESHHFKYIQSPFNLVKTHAYNYANQQGPDGRYYTLMQAIEGFGLNLLASSSLLQMNLFKGKFDQTIRETLGTSELTDIGAALQFARSGNVLSALFGTADSEHVKENMLLAYVPSTKHENIKGLFGAQQHAV